MISTAEPYRPREYRFYRFLWQAVDWVYPPHCAGCGRPGVRWCRDCQSLCERTSTQVCDVCGDPNRKGEVCSSCRSVPPHYAALRSWGIFSGPLRDALHNMKYNKDIGIGESLSMHLIELMGELHWPVEMITPVPLSRERLRERGYNQSALLARPLALATGLPYKPKALWRYRDTRSQVGLNERERLQNVSGAFQAEPGEVKDKIILVIDDVATTGATQSSCAQALLSAGATTVYGLTLARTANRVHA